MSASEVKQIKAKELPPDEVAGQEKADEEFYYASQWELMWWRFRQHKLAYISAILLGVLYLIAIFAEFFMPYDAWNRFP